MDIWNQEDERQLLALLARRKVTHERNAERLMELGYTVQLTQESAGSKYIIVWWDNEDPAQERGVR